MTFEGYLQLHTMCTIAEQVVLVTLFCEIVAVLWRDENAKVGAFLGETLIFSVFTMTNIMSVMGPIITGLITLMISLAIIRATMTLPATVKHYLLVSRCKKACEQNQRRPLSAKDICRLCQAYCRQVRQKNNY